MNELFSILINKYFQKTLIPPESVYFICNGKQINIEVTAENQMNLLDKQNNKMKILVNKLP